MRKYLYAIRDTLAEEFLGGIHLFPQDAPAVRFFSDIAGDRNNMVGQHTADFTLVCLGEFDASSGEVVPQLRDVLTGAQLLAAQDAAAQAKADQEARR